MTIILFAVYDKVIPGLIVTSPGSDITIKCDTYGDLEPKWFLNHAPLPPSVEESGKYLIVDKVEKHHRGKYECIGRADNEHFSLFSSSCTVKFKGKLIFY